jgi:hypothetical protein
MASSVWCGIAEVGKRKSWSDCLWLASLNVVPYAGEKSSV